MTEALILAVVYLLGGYVVLALLAKFEPGAYTEWDLLLWCLLWPVWLILSVPLLVVELRGFWGKK